MASISDVNQLCRYLCDADTDNYSAANLLINVNQAYEETVSDILLADGRFQFDDNNFTTFPTGTTTLVNGQRDYQFDVSHLKVIGVSVKDVNGNWYKLIPFDPSDTEIDRAEFMETSGAPQHYDVDGSSVVLYPAPDNGVSVTLTSGLKIYFQRTADVFTSAQVTTGTKVPGFASPFHMILAYKAAIPYCLKYKPERLQMLTTKVETMRAELKKFYSQRNKDESPRLRMAPIRGFR